MSTFLELFPTHSCSLGATVESPPPCSPHGSNKDCRLAVSRCTKADAVAFQILAEFPGADSGQTLKTVHEHGHAYSQEKR